jgi:hypothetical protein
MEIVELERRRALRGRWISGTWRTVVVFAFLVAAQVGCAQTYKDTSEYINAPIDLRISLIATQTYSLSFYSDNTEGGFSGYGIFTGTSANSFDTYPSSATTAAQGFCDLTSQPEYRSTVSIYVGAAANGVAAGTAICDLTALTLTSGSYVAVRARLERTEKAWSAAAIIAVP